MRKNPSPESGLFSLRLVCSVILIALGCSLAFLSYAAAPPSGTIAPTSSPVMWTGTAPGVPPAVGGEADCEEGANCDTFQLTISGVPNDWLGKQVKVR
ncbi:MAG: hypothetical protein H0V54_03830, partial [Chthoniobacterales bacterium]|nr:hypothetical protein [Chthoniobacterales bacterium]